MANKKQMLDEEVRYKSLLSAIPHIFVGFFLAYLCVESVFALLTALEIRKIYFSVHSGFFYQAGVIFRGNPTIIFMLFIATMISWILQVYFTFSKKRDRNVATGALWFTLLFLILFLYALHKLILLYPAVILVPLGLAIMLILSHRHYPWGEILKAEIFENLTNARKYVRNFEENLNEINAMTMTKKSDSFKTIIKEIEEKYGVIEEINKSIDWIEEGVMKKELDVQSVIKKSREKREDAEILSLSLSGMVESLYKEVKNKTKEYISEIDKESNEVVRKKLLDKYLPGDMKEMYKEEF